MVGVGEQTGHLGEVFGRLAEHYQAQVKLRRTFLSAIAWPMFQLLAALVVVGLLILVMGIIGNMNGVPIDMLGLGLVGNRGGHLSGGGGRAGLLLAGPFVRQAAEHFGSGPSSGPSCTCRCSGRPCRPPPWPGWPGHCT